MLTVLPSLDRTVLSCRWPSD